MEQFDSGIDGWLGAGVGGATSEVSWDSEEQLVWSIKTGADQSASLFHPSPELSNADGLTIRLTSTERRTMLVLALQESDESVYCLILPLDKGVYAEYTIPYSAFGLHPESEDENGQLDIDHLSNMILVDISAAISTPNENRVLIDEVALWKGAPDTRYFTSDESDPPSPAQEFRIGVDANFIPQGEKAGHGFWVGDQRVDPLELFAANGANSLRLRLWVGEEGESRLDYATELAQRAQQAGLKPYLVLFLTEYWADVGKQPAPSEWVALNLKERADVIRQYSFDTAKHFLDQDITFDFYEIGNEIDYGICGVFADLNHPRDVESLQKDIWPDEARLIQAAIEGIKRADTDAKILLHIASSGDPPLALAFFQTMVDFGVEYDYMGLSHYPTAFGLVAASRLQETLDRLTEELGKPIFIAEAAYPAQTPWGGPFGGWRYALPGYTMTPEGQARWVRDFLIGMRNRGDVLGVYVFSPDFWWSGELWEPFALFDGEGQVRPGVASFNTNK
ncbi:glycosyl hydrolase 53 family protein [Chloroflexota bacterium]